MLLGLLPLAAFGLGWLTLGNLRPPWGWDRSFLRAVVFLGAYAVLGSEVLSLAHGLTRWGLVGLWMIPVVGLSAYWIRSTYRGSGIRLPRLTARLSLAEWVLVVILGAVLVITGVVAFMAPPNTWDSLTYHMARVAHWAQAGSLEHYATGIERQNLMPPGAEIGMLHAYVLGAGDRLVNFPQWLAMAASLVGAGAIARLLGASRPGQLAAAVFVATLRMGIAQATSTMTDYVVAIWVVCVAFESVALFVEPPRGRPDVIPLALATGLAILTKPTAFPYVAPFGLTVAYVILRRGGWRQFLRAGVLVVALVGLINAGYFGRNLQTYGHPLGSQRKLGTHANETIGAKALVSNLLRNASLHAGTPWHAVNDFTLRGIIWIHLKMGQSLTDPRITVHRDFQILRPTPDEARSGNLWHAATAMVALGFLVTWWLRGFRQAGLPLLYLAICSASFVLLSSAFKFSVFGSRYHVGFFVLIAAAVGYVVGRIRVPWLVALLAVGLALTSQSWLLRLNERPLLTDKRGRSVLTTPRESLYFVLGRGLEAPYREVAARVQAAECSSVGIMLSGDAAEYPWWPLLGAPRGEMRIEWIVAGTSSDRYADPSFHPCAVICDGSCPSEWTDVRGLPLRLETGGQRLFLETP